MQSTGGGRDIDESWRLALHSSARAAGQHTLNATMTSHASTITSASVLSSSAISNGAGVRGLSLPERHISQHSLHLSELASRTSHVSSSSILDDDIEDDQWQWPFLDPRRPSVASSLHDTDASDSHRSTLSSRPALRVSTSSEETTTNGKRRGGSAIQLCSKQGQRDSFPSPAVVLALPSPSHRRSESFLDLGGGASPKNQPSRLPSRLSTTYTATSSEHETSIFGQKGMQVQIEDLTLDIEHADVELEREGVTSEMSDSMIASDHTAPSMEQKIPTDTVDELRKAVIFYQRDCLDATKDCAYWQSEYLLLLKQYRAMEDLANQLKVRVQVMERCERRLRIMQQLKGTARVDDICESGEMTRNGGSKDVASKRTSMLPAMLSPHHLSPPATQTDAAPRRTSMTMMGRRRSSSCVFTGRHVDAIRRPAVDLIAESEMKAKDGHIAQWLLEAHTAVAQTQQRQEDDPLSPMSQATPPPSVQSINAQSQAKKRLHHPADSSRSKLSSADTDNFDKRHAQRRGEATRDSMQASARKERAFEHSTARRSSDAEPVIDFHGFDVRATLPASLSKLLAASAPSTEHRGTRSKGRHPFANSAYHAKQ